MTWRRTELSEFGREIIWLENVDAMTAYQRAASCLSETHYGLNSDVFSFIERLNVDDQGLEAREWLQKRVGSAEERLLLVFGSDEICTVRALFFLDHWRELFRPSRDDVVILPCVGSWALFYCHEDEFEFSRG